MNNHDESSKEDIDSKSENSSVNISNKSEKDENNENNDKKCKFFSLILESDEQKRLGSYPALKTLVLQSIGPLFSQIITSMYLIVDSYWVSHTIGSDGLTAIGAASLLESINNSFGFYLSVCVSARISYLFGQKKNEECAQVFVDIIRISWIFSIILPIIILNITKPMTKWFGAGEKIQEMGLQYMIPISGLTIFYEMYQICCGCLQSEGLSWIYGICQICSLLLNMVCLDPLFLIAFKMPIWGASLASIISSFLPMTVLMVLIFKGKFTIKPTFRMFCNKFTSETKSALKQGLTTLVIFLSGNIPNFVIQKWLGNSGNAVGLYNEVLSAWNVVIRIDMFVVGINNAISQGLLPSASFAFGAQRLKRIRNLAFHAFWIGTLWNVICEIIIMTNARRIAKIWLTDEVFLDLAEKFFKHGFFTMFLDMVKIVPTTILQSCKKIVISIIQSIISLLIPIPVISTILYLTDKDNPPRLLYTFPLNDILLFIIYLTIALINLPFLFKKNQDLEKNKIFGNKEADNDMEPSYLNDGESEITENSSNIDL